MSRDAGHGRKKTKKKTKASPPNMHRRYVYRIYYSLSQVLTDTDARLARRVGSLVCPYWPRASFPSERQQ